jgi:hypothetical protein
LLKSSSPFYTLFLAVVAFISALMSVRYGSLEMLYFAGVVGGAAWLHWHYSFLKRKVDEED